MTRFRLIPIVFVSVFVAGGRLSHVEGAAVSGPPSAKPKVYNHIGKGSGRSREAEIKAHYSNKYTIVDIGDQGYVRSEATRIVIPRAVVQFGQLMSGSVRVAFIVTAEGKVADTFVVTSTNRQLNSKVTDIIQQWRGRPARLNGVPIATLRVQDFTFLGRGQTIMLRKALNQRKR
jgi:TonB family protein